MLVNIPTISARALMGAAVLMLVLLGWTLPASAEQRFMTVGTAGVTGVYYPVGGAICRLVNRGQDEHGLRCSAESTEGSIFNINALRGGELDVAIVQSDWQYHAYHGSDRFADAGAFEDLRSLFSLQVEAFTVAVRPDADVETFADLRGKRVNIGNPGSGQRGTMNVIMDALGWDYDDFARTAELPSREQAQALCDNEVDAIVFVVGHPTGSIQEPISTCDARLVPVTHDDIEQLVDETPYYLSTEIPGGMYPGHDEPVRTFGVGATLVTTADAPDALVQAVMSAVFDNLDTFRELHPALEILEPETMLREGRSAPVHDAARAYLEEAGYGEHLD